MLSGTTSLHSVQIVVEVYTLAGSLVFEKLGGGDSCLTGLAWLLAPVSRTEAHLRSRSTYATTTTSNSFGVNCELIVETTS